MRYDPSNDYYAVLGVRPNATPDELRTARRRKMREVHPDRHAGDARSTRAAQLVNEAYDVLSRADLRTQYDALRAAHLRRQHARARQTRTSSTGPRSRPQAGARSSHRQPNVDDVLRTAFKNAPFAATGTVIATALAKQYPGWAVVAFLGGLALEVAVAASKEAAPNAATP